MTCSTNMISGKWIPAISDGKFQRLTLSESMDRPISDIQSGRPDFDFSVLLIAIGIEQTGFNPPPLLGSGARFLQSKNALNGTKKPVGQLLLDEPGENAIKKGTDFFVRGNQRNQLCTPCATLALYAHAQFCGPLGPGLYPGNLFHNAIYLQKGATLRETIGMNLIDDFVDTNAYFSVPNDYWLNEPEHTGECALCHKTGPLITDFWRGKGRSVSYDNPHCAKTYKGNRYAIGVASSMIDIIEGAAPNSNLCISPLAIRNNAKVGDIIIGFGTYYDKASLKRTFEAEFTLRNCFNVKPINDCIKALFKIMYPLSDFNNKWNSTFCSGVRENISNLVCGGLSEIEAALTVYDMYCPNPGIRSRHYKKWINNRNIISG